MSYESLPFTSSKIRSSVNQYVATTNPVVVPFINIADLTQDNVREMMERERVLRRQSGKNMQEEGQMNEQHFGVVNTDNILMIIEKQRYERQCGMSDLKDQVGSGSGSGSGSD